MFLLLLLFGNLCYNHLCHHIDISPRYDYQELLYNSTFCLVPRGRRLGSFRFLESLQAGCIPVVMSDGWNLPFSSVIDWSRAVLHISEKALLQVPIILRSISRLQILSMKQQGIFLYYTYFSSIHQIISTTLKVFGIIFVSLFFECEVISSYSMLCILGWIISGSTLCSYASFLLTQFGSFIFNYHYIQICEAK